MELKVLGFVDSAPAGAAEKLQPYIDLLLSIPAGKYAVLDRTGYTVNECKAVGNRLFFAGKRIGRKVHTNNQGDRAYITWSRLSAV